MSTKLKIIARAIDIRLKKGEDLEEIIASYPNLTEEEKTTLRVYFD